jgi:hypothetical protein
MVEIMWHRRETRRQTENTNVNLEHQEEPIYSTDTIMPAVVRASFVEFELCTVKIDPNLSLNETKILPPKIGSCF